LITTSYIVHEIYAVFLDLAFGLRVRRSEAESSREVVAIALREEG
jgi:hypothetical protein